MSETGVGQTSTSLEFLQQRVGAFGFAVGALLFASVLVRIILGVSFGYLAGELRHPSFIAHALSWVPVALVWLLCKSGPLSVRTIHVVEALGLCLTGICLVVMGAYLPAAAGAATTSAYALSFVLITRAVFVPSSARHTALLGFALGVPLAIAVYLNFVGVDLAVWNSHGFFRKINDARALARSQTVQIALVWALTTLLAAWATHVIHGLRRDVRDAKKLGQYIVEEKLGEGGMGEVYRAHHGMLKRPTAIKLLIPDRNTPEDLERFRREVQTTARLKHPNTVTIYDYGRTEEGTFYYAMELLDGVTLTEIVAADGGLPQSRVVHILQQCARALQEAHELGVVHRDVKPNNVMMTQQGGEVDVTKVLDFGLVKNVGPGADVTKTVSESIIGTPRFMSPEQIVDPPSVDARSDLYALGAIGYYLLTGGFVFQGTGAIEICAMHLSADPELPSARANRSIDSDLEALIMQCLEKRRQDRPESAAAMANRLASLAIEPWTQAEARAWWASTGDTIVSTRDPASEVGSLKPIHAGRKMDS